MLALFLLPGLVAGSMIDLTPTNLDETLKGSSLVMINFSAGWCRYSQALKPIYEKAADAVSDVPGVKLAYADCVAHNSICSKYQVSKYPTMKFVRSGEILKSEYRGQRSVEAITEHINSLMKDPVLHLHGDLELQRTVDENKGKFVMGYFESNSGYSYEVFKASAQIMSGQCSFYAMIGEDAKPMMDSFGGKERVMLLNDVEGDKTFEGKLTEQVQLSAWVKDNCVPLVREITFENGEELTEEGLPFVILFHDPEDKESVKKFTEKVAEQCQDQRSSVNFLHANGFKFAHPLSHLGKTTNDLPVIAIDSFKHMYLFPKFENINRPGRLRRFVEDLHSGRLHREFHGEVFRDRDGEDDDPVGKVEGNSSGQKKEKKREAVTNPPESVFKKLEPNKNRYSILNKDEL